ncbi:uncharacterized protein EDB93DRAFT_1328085 [Suillus bovinus]|uniref:uncharacterized protein n=1 Tax=Suillus bovinus TaxID=48563 RepID=UPI001B885F86|nr:uncharacterized protein EDB93DRAFT_1328085 [Suillus bovinus]KAG2150319.1 hypothetical protein EDB93DRAFT_1328085 [Suillus bovinus]
MAGRAAIFALFSVVGVLGYSDTVPIVAWSSKSSSVLNGLFPDLRYEDSVSIVGGVLSPEDVCSFDTVLVINQPGLRSSDLRALPKASSGLSAILNTAPSSRQYPHVKRSASSFLQDVTESLARRCGSTLTNASPADGPLDLAENSRHVVCVNMPAIEGGPKLRKAAMMGYDQYLSSEIEKIDAAFTSHLVLYMGSPLEHYRRQLLPPSKFDSAHAPPDNSTISDGGIFKRYQLFSTPLLVALLVVFFIIVPIIMMAVSALASLQSSVRLEAPKGYHAQEKKTQ